MHFQSNDIMSQPKDYLITSYGAKADGVTNNSSVIQKVIDEAAKNGGGKVIVPAGNFVTGTIWLKSNVELYLELGARLLGSVEITDYSNSRKAIVAAENQNNISLTGNGIIDGQANELVSNIFKELQAGKLDDAQWRFKRPTEAVRPKLVELVDCEGVSIKDVKMINAANWVQNYVKCVNLTIDNIKVESTAYWNNDGIDISDCKNVRVTNCFVNSSDDGICLKSENRANLCEDIYVENCTVRSSANAFKLGTASKGGFKNVKVNKLYVYDTYRSAVALESVDGGILENVEIKNVEAKNTGNAIFIRLGKRNTDNQVAQIKNVRISNLKAEIPLRKPDLGYPFEGPPDYLRGKYLTSSKQRPDLGYPTAGLLQYPYNLIPSSIVGIPEGKPEGIVFENIEITFEGGGDKYLAQIKLDSLSKVPEKISDYPEFSMFGELPAWGFFVRHAKDITMKNVNLSYKEFDFRPALVFDDVFNVDLKDVQVLSGEELPFILLNNSSKKKFDNIKLPDKNSIGIKEQWTK
jgi:hypothetical protein